MFMSTTEKITSAMPIYPSGKATASSNMIAPVIVATTGSMVAIIDAVLALMCLSASVYVRYGNTADSKANKMQKKKSPVLFVIRVNTGLMSVTQTDARDAKINV